MRAGDRAWLALGAAIVVYELGAEQDELLSEAADRWMLTHPWLVRTAALVLACHVANISPQRLDPIHWLFTLKPRRDG